MTELLDALGNAVKHKVCNVSGCQTNPITTRNGRPLCAHHRDYYDHATLGEPCERCESRNYIATPDGETVAVCATCEKVTYDESVIEDSW